MVVKRINNLTDKSFNNYSGPNDNKEFNDYNNVIFGYNGRGKSTLAREIKRQYINSNSNIDNVEETIRYFDSDYVSDNLILEQGNSKTIKGVIANFGSQNVDLEKQIAQKTQDLERVKEEISKKEGNRDIDGQKIYNIMEEIHNRVKGTRSKLPNLATKDCINKGFDECIEAHRTNYNNVVSSSNPIATDNDLSNFKPTDNLEDKIANIEKISIPRPNLLSSFDLDKLQNICEEIFDDKSLPKPVLDWISDGINLHDGKTHCLFCGGEIKSLDEIKSSYEKNRQQKASQAAIDLAKYKSILENLIALINDANKCEQTYTQNFFNVDKQWFLDLLDLSTEINRFIEVIDNKSSHMDKKVDIDIKKLEGSQNKIVSIFTSLDSAKRNASDYMDTQSKKRNDIIRAATAREIINNKALLDSIEKHTQLIKEINDLRGTVSSLQNDIDGLRRQKSNYNDFADDINDILKNMEVDLKLELSGKNYVIKHAKSNKLLDIKEISEGEKNLLALLYFYCELFDDKEKKNFKSNIGLVIIDDPISSLDDSNKIFILNLIENICHRSSNNTQTFILTHVWDDFADMFKLYSHNVRHIDDGRGNVTDVNDFSFWEVKKDKNSESYVEATRHNNILTPYRYAFHQICEAYDKCTKEGVDSLGNDVYGLPNLMRCVLERYCEFKTGTSGHYLQNENAVAPILCGKNPSDNDIANTKLLIDVCNAFSHRDDRNPTEIYNALKFFINKIRVSDPVHLDSMKQL